MASNLLSLEYEDIAGAKGTFSMYLEDDYAAGDPEVLALVQAFKNMSQAKILGVTLAQEVDISTLTGNSAAVSTGSFDRVRDQAILQLKRADNTGYLSVTVPAPVDAILMATGPYQMQDVNPASALILAFIAAGITEPAIATPQGGLVTFSKGWRKGQPHS
jgi:hypothetical protein